MASGSSGNMKRLRLVADVDVSLVVGNVGLTYKNSEFISSIRKVLQQIHPWT